MLLPLIGAATVGVLYATGWYLPRNPRALNMPDKKKLLELPPPLHAHVLAAAVDMVHIMALVLLLMFCCMQYGAWESAHSGSSSPALVAGVIFGVAVLPLVTIGFIVAIQRRNRQCLARASRHFSSYQPLNVSHRSGSPDSKPLRNHCVRWADVPCVKDSGTTRP